MKKVKVVAPGEGEFISRPETGGAATLKLTGADTDGGLTVWTSRREVGDVRGPATHVHDFDEVFFVLAGEYAFTVEGSEAIAGKGGLVFVPGGVEHSFQSSGKLPGELLSMGMPAGIEEFFRAQAAGRSTDNVVRFVKQGD